MKKINIPIDALEEKVAALPSAHKALIIIGPIALMSILFYFFVYQSQETKLRKLKNTVAQEEKKLASLKQAAAQVETLEKTLAEAEAEFMKVAALLPDQKEIPSLLENISEIGAEVGLENILFQPQGEQARDFYASIPVRLDLAGSFHKLGIFFDTISKLNRILKVENIALTRQREGSNLSVSCTITTYRFIEQAAQASPKK